MPAARSCFGVTCTTVKLVTCAVALAYAILPAKTKARLPTWIAGKDVIPPDATVADYTMVAST